MSLLFRIRKNTRWRICHKFDSSTLDFKKCSILNSFTCGRIAYEAYFSIVTPVRKTYFGQFFWAIKNLNTQYLISNFGIFIWFRIWIFVLKIWKKNVIAGLMLKYASWAVWLKDMMTRSSVSHGIVTNRVQSRFNFGP